MFDKKIYVETFSTLHASPDTLAEIRRVTEQRPRKAAPPLHPAFVFSIILVLMVSSAALAAGNRLLYGGWLHHASLGDAVNMGFDYPEQLGAYRLIETSPSRIHMAPPESNLLTAWINPDYIWMSLDYKNDMSQSLTVSFGKMDDPLWAYCFSYNEKNSVWLGAENPEDFISVSADSSSYIENVTVHGYQGRTIYLADRITEYFSENSDIRQSASGSKKEVEAHWTDPDAGLCFAISSKTDQGLSEKDDSDAGIQNMTQNEMLKYVKSIIDHNR